MVARQEISCSACLPSLTRLQSSLFTLHFIVGIKVPNSVCVCASVAGGPAPYPGDTLSGEAAARAEARPRWPFIGQEEMKLPGSPGRHSADWTGHDTPTLLTWPCPPAFSRCERVYLNTTAWTFPFFPFIIFVFVFVFYKNSPETLESESLLLSTGVLGLCTPHPTNVFVCQGRLL